MMLDPNFGNLDLTDIAEFLLFQCTVCYELREQFIAKGSDSFFNEELKASILDHYFYHDPSVPMVSKFVSLVCHMAEFEQNPTGHYDTDTGMDMCEDPGKYACYPYADEKIQDQMV